MQMFGWLVMSPFILGILYIILIPCFTMLVRKFSTTVVSPRRDDAPSYTEVMLKVRDVWCVVNYCNRQLNTIVYFSLLWLARLLELMYYAKNVQARITMLIIHKLGCVIFQLFCFCTLVLHLTIQGNIFDLKRQWICYVSRELFYPLFLFQDFEDENWLFR